MRSSIIQEWRVRKVEQLWQCGNVMNMRAKGDQQRTNAPTTIPIILVSLLSIAKSLSRICADSVWEV